MAAPVIVSKGTQNNGTGTSLSGATLPASIAANDIIFNLCISHQPNGIGAISITPAGWTEAAQGSYLNASSVAIGRASLHWKRMAGGETGQIAMTRTGDTGIDGVFMAQCYRVTGCETTGDPFDQCVFRGGPQSTTVTYNAVTVSGSERTLAAFSVMASNTSVGVPTGYIEGLASDGTTTGTDAALDLDEKDNVASDGAVTATGGSTVGWATFHVSLKPPSGAAPEEIPILVQSRYP